ncbi:beta-galactosidase [Lacticaseibacillus jixiensis]|uniref:beta-galactosidase n=1 Tax=Lacticaseibacillus jixiensis TaxID=3231926 RepID=UPI0036F2997D
MTTQFKHILYGGDYNPEQWPEKVWDEDIQVFKNTQINTATINVFSWANIQPEEDVYDFTELDAIVAKLSGEGIDMILATSTAAMPAWLFHKYPEVARVDYQGLTNKFASRHNFCPTSLVYRHFARLLVEKIVARYHDNPHIVCWHVNNEYNGRCYCERCEQAFQLWCKRKYQTIDALNTAWNMTFWSHRLTDFNQIVLPNGRGDGVHPNAPYYPGMAIDYLRFNSGQMLNLYKMERDIIKASGSTMPITTNFMGAYKWVDYATWAKELDIISWDNYPAYDTPWSNVALVHDLMRGLKQQPFMVMEQTPSQQNYQQYNALKRPGQLRAQNLQGIAHGADASLYFQLRRSVGGAEKFHGAVIEHSGRTDTRVIHEVASAGEALAKLTPVVGAQTHASVALVFDWQSFWGVEYASGPTNEMHYVQQIQYLYDYFYKRNIPVELISPAAIDARYALVVAPVLYMVTPEIAQQIEAYTSQGGVFVTTYMSGMVGDSDNVTLGGYPGLLRDVVGLWVEESDAIWPDKRNQVTFADGTTGECGFLCDLAHATTASVVASYASDFYAGMPAVTQNNYGKGQAYYLATQLDRQTLAHCLDMICAVAQVTALTKQPSALEISRREKDGVQYDFLINFTAQTQPIPDEYVGARDLLSGAVIETGQSLTQYMALVAVRTTK